MFEKLSSNVQVLIVSMPLILFLLYIIADGTMTKTIGILFVCVGLPSIVLYFVLKRYHTPTKEQSPEKLAFLAMESKTIDELFASLQLSISEYQESYHILLCLRKKAHHDANTAVELVHLGMLQHLIRILHSCSILDKRFIACFDLINEILHHAKAREQLFCNEYQCKEIIDSVMDIFVDINSQLHEHGGAFCAPENEEDTVFVIPDEQEVSASQAVSAAHKSVEDVAADREQTRQDLNAFIANGYKILLTIGLLCSENHQKIQTRIADKAAIQLINNYAFNNRYLSLLDGATGAAMTTASNSSNSSKKTPAEPTKNKGDDIESSLVKPVLSAHQKCVVKYHQWGLWSIFNLVCGHPANKGEFYHLGGVRIVIDILKQHRTELEINRQGLALLLILLSNDQYTKYSLTQARQMAMANGVVDVVHAGHIVFKNTPDVIASGQGVLNAVVTIWS